MPCGTAHITGHGKGMPTASLLPLPALLTQLDKPAVTATSSRRVTTRDPSMGATSPCCGHHIATPRDPTACHVPRHDPMWLPPHPATLAWPLRLVMEKFGSDPWSEPEPDRSGLQFGVRVWVLTWTGPTVLVRVRHIPEPLRTGSERVRTWTRSFWKWKDGSKYIFKMFYIVKRRRSLNRKNAMSVMPESCVACEVYYCWSIDYHLSTCRLSRTTSQNTPPHLCHLTVQFPQHCHCKSARCPLGSSNVPQQQVLLELALNMSSPIVPSIPTLAHFYFQSTPFWASKHISSRCISRF